MIHPFKIRLLELGADRLSDLVLLLSDDSRAVHRFGKSPTSFIFASPDEMRERFLEDLANFKKHYFSRAYEDHGEHAKELETLLLKLRLGIDQDPVLGLNLLAELYQLGQLLTEEDYPPDEGVIYIFESDVAQTFLDLARICDDPEFVRKLLFKIFMNDGLGLSTCMFGELASFLPPDQIRLLYDDLWPVYVEASAIDAEWVEFIAEGYMSETVHILMQCLAACVRALGDGDDYVRLIESFGLRLRAADHLDIAEVYMASQFPEKAISWLESLPYDADEIEKHKGQQLLFEVHGKSGNVKAQLDSAEQLLRLRFNRVNLERLLELAGSDRQDWVMGVAEDVLIEDAFPVWEHVLLLLQQEWFELAALYVTKHHTMISSWFYDHTVYVAEQFVERGYALVASLLYRELLLAILEAGHSDGYPGAAYYWHKLESLEAEIDDWQEHADHQQVTGFIKHKYGRKRAFWKACERAKEQDADDDLPF